jgi:hypothetical protein
MSTGSGSARRSRTRLICCIMAGALLVFALGASGAEAKVKKPKHFFYLALGDSITYGYSLVKFDENLAPCKAEGPSGANCEPPAKFEPNLTDYVFGKVKESKKGIKVKPSKKVSTINLACPGETSSGLIGHNVSFGGGAGAEFNPCGWHNTNGFNRHYEYGSVSQVEAAANLINNNPEKQAAAIGLVSINIGSNDELHVLGLCRSAEYRTAHSFTSEAECVEKEAPALFGKILSNIGHSIGVLRTVGYTGDVVVFGFYNPFGVLAHATDALQKALNENLEEQVSKGSFGPGVHVANPFGQFNAAGVGGVTEKTALESFTEFYNPAAIADELANITASEEVNHKPNLAEITAFTEAFGVCGSKLGSKTGRFEDEHCTTENAKKEGEYERTTPNLAEVLAFEEAHGSPNNLAETEAFEEAHGKPNLAETEAFEEASGHPDLAEAEAGTEAFGVCEKVVTKETGRFADENCTTEQGEHKGEYERKAPGNLAETTTFEEEHASPDLAETEAFCETNGCHGGHTLAQEDAAAEAAFFHHCEVEEAKEKSVCEAEWTGGAKVATEEAVDAAFDAGVKAGFDEAVEEGFDEGVDAGFDAAVKAGFDAAVKKAFDETYKFFFDQSVKHAFDEEVRKGFEAAGSPGDIHPSKVGYRELGGLVKANK